MPMRNAEKYLHECIDSIRKQGFTHWELIVINDHSADHSQAIVEAYSRKDSRIQLLPNEGKGIIDALKTAIKYCQGIYLSRMDADDKMPENRLQIMVDTLAKSPEKTVVTGYVKYFGESPISAGYMRYEDWLNTINRNAIQWQNIYRECVIASPNWMVRKDELRAIGGFQDLHYPEDYHLVLKWYQNHWHIEVIPEVTLWWREHPARTSRNSENYQQARFFSLKIRFFLENQWQKQDLVLWGNGEKARISARGLDQQQAPFCWMDLNPEKFAKGIQGHTILSYRKIESYTPETTLILLAIYPSQKQQQQINSYLNALGYILGTNYWYL